MTKIEKSVLTCPHCKHIQKAEIPVDACQYFYKCKNCQQIIKPKDGDCCVFCSYGSRKCFTAEK